MGVGEFGACPGSLDAAGGRWVALPCGLSSDSKLRMDALRAPAKRGKATFAARPD